MRNTIGMSELAERYDEFIQDRIEAGKTLPTFETWLDQLEARGELNRNIQRNK